MRFSTTTVTLFAVVPWLATLLCNPFRVDVFWWSVTQGGAARLRRCAYPGLYCETPSG